MADIQQAIVAELKKDSNIDAKLRNGINWYIFPLIVPEGYITEKKDYYLTYTIVDIPEDPNIDLQKAIIQFNCFASSYANAVSLAKDIKRIFTRFKGILGSGSGYSRTVLNIIKESETELLDDESNYFFIPLRFRFLYLGDNV